MRKEHLGIYCVCANKTLDLINARNSHSRIFATIANVSSDDLYQKIAQKLKS